MAKVPMTNLATSCQIVPFPPKKIGMVYTPDVNNNMSLTSGRELYKTIS